ncbi:DUF1287 domain-containing protein [Pseudoalteromonas shioyasakiensis]|uniref:DUF1287 domain-containing protein n=1 Tax=Pseudoalteromonas shioyasakiensis TaxID=1190813 RepID=UPI002117F33C|nr:DUF1287 domain-containing protein [Pseudoalteromonas shioyasakiensis]MCQ8882789.1 DUF1287 domain-containing protein [Pseudoalteromonas shioyasakiensis]
MIKTALILFSLIAFNTQAQSFQSKLVKAAKERTEHVVVYNGSYRKIDYPNGDVPKNIGVCTDVIIRTYRALGIDLQALVHEDMRDNFTLYPSKRIWGLTKPDTNIDHRRVPNLQVFFEKFGTRKVISKTAADYQAGDIVTWVLPNNRPHIGIVTDELSEDQLRPLIVHNIGRGPKMEDMLFNYKITGHYRFEPNLSK